MATTEKVTNTALYSELGDKPQCQVISSFHSFLHNCEANEFSKQITMSAVILSFMAVNPRCKKNARDLWVLDTSVESNFVRVRSLCYESVKPKLYQP